MSFRYAERKDTKLILQFIKELADYENMSEDVEATPELLEEWSVYRVAGKKLKELSMQ